MDSKAKALKWAAAAAIIVLLGGVGVYAATGGFSRASDDVSGSADNTSGSADNSSGSADNSSAPADGISGPTNGLSVKKITGNIYVVSAEIARIPMKDLKGEVNEASEIIPEQFREHMPYDNWFPGNYRGELDSAEEAAAYIGYSGLQTPYFPYNDADTEVSVIGKSDGSFSQITIMTDNYKEKVMVQSWTTLFTESYDQDVFDSENHLAAGAALPSDAFTTKAGLLCLVFESNAEAANRKGMTAYICTGGILYTCHTSFNSKDRDAAKQIIHEWAESLKNQ